MARKCGAAGLQLLVIDTENKFVSTGFAEEIAKAANGETLPSLPAQKFVLNARGLLASTTTCPTRTMPPLRKRPPPLWLRPSRVKRGARLLYAQRGRTGGGAESAICGANTQQWSGIMSCECACKRLPRQSTRVWGIHRLGLPMWDSLSMMLGLQELIDASPSRAVPLAAVWGLLLVAAHVRSSSRVWHSSSDVQDSQGLQFVAWVDLSDLELRENESADRQSFTSCVGWQVYLFLGPSSMHQPVNANEVLFVTRPEDQKEKGQGYPQQVCQHEIRSFQFRSLEFEVGPLMKPPIKAKAQRLELSFIGRQGCKVTMGIKLHPGSLAAGLC
eukprot:1153395-Pelagomonas_calceolata.AAC.3